jgi:hypothetical protein
VKSGHLGAQKPSAYAYQARIIQDGRKFTVLISKSISRMKQDIKELLNCFN